MLAAWIALSTMPRRARAQNIDPTPSPAHATATSAPVPTEAVEIFTRAVELLQDGRHAAALELLERVRTMHETPAVLFNIAIAQRATGRNLAAIASLERYLALAADRIDDVRRSQVGERIRELRASIARLTLHVDPAIRSVSLDDQPLERWDEPIPLDPGRHTVRGEGAGLRPVEITLVLGVRENARVDIAAEPLGVDTRLRLQVNPPNADVLVDRVLVGSGNYAARVRPGRHSVEVRAPAYQAYTASFTVLPGQTAILDARLVRELPLSRRWWVWTAAAVVVTGAAIGISIAAGSRIEDCDPGSAGVCF